MTKTRISDVSLSDIEDARRAYDATRKLVDKECKWCGTVFKQKRAWQDFCKPEHRVSFHQNEDRLYIEKLEALLSTKQRILDETTRELTEANKTILILQKKSGQ